MLRTTALLGAVLSASAATFIDATPGVGGQKQYVPGEYLVVMKQGVSLAAHEGVAARFSGKKFSIGSSFRAVHLATGEAGVAELLAHPDVQFVERNQIARAIKESSNVTVTRKHSFSCGATQVEPLSWGQKRVTTPSAKDVEDIYEHDAAWGQGVKVYVLDTGVRITHEEFDGGRATWGANFAGGADQDANGHGTHCAGTIGGKTYGVAKAASIVAVKVLSDQGSGSYDGIISGIEWVVKQGKGVINMSLGGGFSAALNAAVDAASAEGVVFSNAAGNDNRDACNYSPASAPTGVCVGSTELANRGGEQVDARSSFSNYGTCTTLFAPGSSIIAAYKGSDTAYATLSGTSMAAPHVAGVLAIGMQANPSYSPAELKNWVASTATEGLVENAGSGSPNLMLHVDCSGPTAPPTPSPPTPPPTPSPPTPAPTPSPTGTTFTQKSCHDGLCSFACQTNTFRFNECVQSIGSGGSLIATACDSTGVTMTKWPLSSDCSGSFVFHEVEPVNRCLLDYSWFENTCGGSEADIVKGAKAHVVRKS
eukprot:Hpha_TRINITY_DN15501_c4_g3::TRINITY_DN15501_c4_g3_i2::g.105572::m.105572/K01336/E3.4.21.48; cerevisin